MSIAIALTRNQLADLHRIEIAKLSFIDFLESYVQIESDDKRQRGSIPFHLYPYQRDRAEAWGDGDSEIILKARQLGFTWLAAAFALWTAAYHPSSHVAIFSAGAREMRKFIRRVRYVWKRLPVELQAGGVPAIESFAFANESMISGFPSTEDAGIGETNRLVVFDEWAFHAYGAENLAAVLPTIAAGGQLIAMSTADPQLGPTGHFFDAYMAAAEDESSEFTAVFVEWWARPERQLPCTCPGGIHVREHAADQRMADHLDAAWRRRRM